MNVNLFIRFGISNAEQRRTVALHFFLVRGTNFNFDQPATASKTNQITKLKKRINNKCMHKN